MGEAMMSGECGVSSGERVGASLVGAHERRPYSSSLPAPWKVTGASVIGTSHRRSGLPCQDSSDYRVVDGVLIAAVADGAGSASMSDIGSALAAETSVRVVERLLGEYHDHSPHPIHETCLNRVITSAVEEARREIHEEAGRREVEVRQLATTLLLAVHTPSILAAAQIGDGAMVVSDGPGAYETFIVPQRGEYANQTSFLTSSDAMTKLDVRVERVDGDAARLAMFTDGIQNLVLRASDDSPHAPFFDPVFNWMRAQPASDDTDRKLAAFLESPRVTGRADDDLTLLLATRAE